jgi:uncharacterized protein YecT (DUF1311 family)
MKPLIGCALLFALVALPGTSAIADQKTEEANLKEARQNCKPAGNQQEMNQCAAADYYAADLEMNRLYGTQMARLSTGKGALRESQKAWLVFRDKVCAYEVPADNGSIYSMSVSLCLAKHTKQRVEDLRAYVACTDNGCPE